MSLVKCLIILLSLSFFQVSVAQADSSNAHIKKRQARQAQRIKQGVDSGNLTKKETRNLVRQQRRINRSRKRALNDDGKIGKRERRSLRVRQKHASRNIYRKKHNKRERSTSESAE